MKKESVQQPIKAALFAAIICLSTMLFKIPLTGGGYANMGDCFVIVGGCLLNNPFGWLAAAIGSAFADLFAGYVSYAFATFVIKGLMAFTVFKIFTAMKKYIRASVIISSVIAEIIMVVLYFAYEFIVYGFPVAILDVAGNLGQGAVGVLGAFIIMTAVQKSDYLSSLFK